VSDAAGHVQLPVPMGGTRPSCDGQRHEPIAVTVDEQHGTVDGVEGPCGGRRSGQQGGQRAARAQVGGVTLTPIEAGRELDEGVDHLRRDPRGIGAADPQHALDVLPGRCAAPPGVEEALTEAGDGADEEVGHDPGMDDAGSAGYREGRVDEHEASHALRIGRRLERGHQPAHRIPDQHHRLVAGGSQDTAEQPAVALDVGRSPGGGSAAMAQQVHGEKPGPPGQEGRHGQPIEMRATQSVHGHEQPAVVGPAVVGDVHRPVEVEGAGERQSKLGALRAVSFEPHDRSLRVSAGRRPGSVGPGRREAASRPPDATRANASSPS
jgi:hypothetical protein